MCDSPKATVFTGVINESSKFEQWIPSHVYLLKSQLKAFKEQRDWHDNATNPHTIPPPRTFDVTFNLQ